MMNHKETALQLRVWADNILSYKGNEILFHAHNPNRYGKSYKYANRFLDRNVLCEANEHKAMFLLLLAAKIEAK